MEEILDSAGSLAAPSTCDAMRGSNIVVGRRWLRERQLEHAYLAALGDRDRDAVVAVGAADWVPLSLVMAHYDALDALPIGHEERVDFGGAVSRTINGIVLTTVARLAGRAGLSPFVPLSRAASIFARNYRGGAVGVYRTGPTEARFEVLGAPMATSITHRETVEGALLDGGRPFSSLLAVTEILGRRTASSYAFRLRW